MIKLQFQNKFQKKYLELEFIQLQYSIPKHCSSLSSALLPDSHIFHAWLLRARVNKMIFWTSRYWLQTPQLKNTIMNYLTKLWLSTLNQNLTLSLQGYYWILLVII